MSEKTNDNGAIKASINWKDYECKVHEDAMLEILREDCGLKTSGSVNIGDTQL